MAGATVPRFYRATNGVLAQIKVLDRSDATDVSVKEEKSLEQLAAESAAEFSIDAIRKAKMKNPEMFSSQSSSDKHQDDYTPTEPAPLSQDVKKGTVPSHKNKEEDQSTKVSSPVVSKSIPKSNKGAFGTFPPTQPVPLSSGEEKASAIPPTKAVNSTVSKQPQPSSSKKGVTDSTPHVPSRPTSLSEEVKKETVPPYKNEEEKQTPKVGTPMESSSVLQPNKASSVNSAELAKVKKMAILSLAGLAGVMIVVVWLGISKSSDEMFTTFKQELTTVTTATNQKVVAVNKKVTEVDEAVGVIDKRMEQIEDGISDVALRADIAIVSAEKADQKAVTALRQSNSLQVKQKFEEKGGEVVKKTDPSSRLIMTPVATPTIGGETVFLWHPYDATIINPKLCIVSKYEEDIFPKYCSSFKVITAFTGESKNSWLVRVGGGKKPVDTGNYQKQ